MHAAAPSAGFPRLAAIVAAPLVIIFSAQDVAAQATSAATFDISRFSNAGKGWFETFFVEETHSLQQILDAGTLSADAGVLVTETADGPLALVTDQMAFHHIAQGTAGGKDWMATF